MADFRVIIEGFVVNKGSRLLLDRMFGGPELSCELELMFRLCASAGFHVRAAKLVMKVGLSWFQPGS